MVNTEGNKNLKVVDALEGEKVIGGYKPGFVACAAFLLATLLFLGGISPGIAAPELPARMPEPRVEAGKLSLVDCPENPGDNKPHTVTLQIIDNVFHRWREYRQGDSLFVFLEEPEWRPLDADEARELLAASQEWTTQAGLPAGHLEEQPGRVTDVLARAGNGAVAGCSAEELSAGDGRSGQWASVWRSQEVVEAEPPVWEQARGIFGDDERDRITSDRAGQFPWCTIGYVRTHNRLSGTGFLVSPHAVITNAHNVYRSEYGGWSEQLRFYPGQTQDEPGSEVVRPLGGEQALDAAIPRGYLTYEDDINRSIRYDFAAMFFKKPFPEINTFMPLEFDYYPRFVNTAGYPPVVQGETRSLAMWYSFGAVTEIHPEVLFFEADASEGHSGGPLWVFDPERDTDRVVGTLAVIGSLYNAGPRFSTHNQEMLEEWMRWTPGAGPPPKYTLTIRVEGEGDTDPAPGDYLLAQGEPVGLRAQADPGWEFKQWVVEGEAHSMPEFVLTMDSDKEVTAHFVKEASTDVQGVVFFIGSHRYLVDGEPLDLDVPPFILNGRTFIPMRFLAQALGAEVDWEPRDGQVETVYFQDQERLVTANTEEEILTVYEKATGQKTSVSMDVAPIIRDGRTFLPFRFLAQAFDLDVDYEMDPEKSTVERVWFTR